METNNATIPSGFRVKLLILLRNSIYIYNLYFVDNMVNRKIDFKQGQLNSIDSVNLI